MKGRKIGSIEVTLKEMQTIQEMTGSNTRKEIAIAVHRSTNTVWRYQKKLGLL